MMEKYNPAAIEKKWQERWSKAKIFEAKKRGKNYYLLEMLPYPSGRIHMGHVRNYTIGDTIARFKLMNGYNVLHPIGFDAFGMPAENAAIAHNIAPKQWTLENINYMEKELKTLGFSYDWSREIITCLPEYYKWEQKIFIEMYKKNMAYRKDAAANFCNKCQTVLANEQVEDGCCWRCGEKVEKKRFSQWFFKITDYADELLEDMKQIENGWPEKVLTMQRHWIGKSYGSMVDFRIEGTEKFLSVFTTRPDTLFGVTFVSIAPLHSDLPELIAGSPQEKEIKKFIEKNSTGTTSEAELAKREKEGVFTGIQLVNPVNGQKVPLYTANFVVTDYGTGVVMGVPAHDQRDYDFAKKYNIPIKYVILPDHDISKDAAYIDKGVLVDSGPFSGLSNTDANNKITQFLEKHKLGRTTAQYRLRDWNVSRQRYWGAPIPVIYCRQCGIVPVPEKDLPVVLPDNMKISGEGGSPLKNDSSFVNTTCPKCGRSARRETDTFDTFVESSWYFLRYISPRENAPFNKAEAEKWMPVDQYIGGVEHAVMHLLYARYFTKVLRDLGYINCDEPFARLLTQGMVIKDGAKMSKSKGNVVNPDKLISRYGADTARLFSLFAAPPEKELNWSDAGVAGAYRFLGRVWNLLIPLSKQLPLQETGKDIDLSNLPDSTKSFLSLFNNTIKKITVDMENYHFNTVISKLMELTSSFSKFKITCEHDRTVAGVAASGLIRMLAPMVPHFAEEIWEKFGGKPFVSKTKWPKYNKQQIFVDKFNIAVTINGKLRDQICIDPETGDRELEKLALASPKVIKFTAGRAIKKVIVIKNKIVNVVI
ncbi:MAG: leucine--tRNA ligase [Epsilonproteobacteria bacterium]|nr:leucine--tRNA ligase [Campylobacterota bacterium]